MEIKIKTNDVIEGIISNYESVNVINELFENDPNLTLSECDLDSENLIDTTLIKLTDEYYKSDLEQKPSFRKFASKKMLEMLDSYIFDLGLED